MSQAPNLTREQAQQRARTVAVAVLRDHPRPHGRRGRTWREDIPDPKRDQVHGDPRCARRSSTSSGTGSRTADAQRHRRWTSAAGRPSGGLALPDLAESNELIVDAVGLYMNTGEGLHRFVDPVDGAVYLYSQFETADAKRLYACFDQPDLKATFTVQVTAPADWQVVANGATVSVEDGPGRRRRCTTSSTTEPMSTYVTALVAGPYHVVRDHHDGIDLGPVLPGDAGRAPGRRAAVHRDQAGLRLLPRRVRGALPVRQVRPAVRAGVQRRRHGERRRGHLPRGVRLPLQGHPLPLRARAARRSCTRWPTCGSAIWSPCAGGTTCG